MTDNVIWALTAVSLTGTVLNIRKNIWCFSFERSEKQGSRVPIGNL